MAEKPIYRQSQIKTYLKCGKLYEFVYVMGIKKPPKAALTVGSSVDAAVNANLLNKIRTGELLNESDVADACVTAFDKRAPETDFAGEKPGELKDVAVACTKTHHNFIAPKIKPLTVQEEFHLETTAEYDLAGTFDIIEKNGTIVDTKTASRAYDDSTVFRDLQAAGYDFAFQSLYKKKSKGFRWDVLIKRKHGAHPQQIQTKVTNADRKWFFYNVEQAHKGIKAGIAAPAPDLPNVWWCSAKWCAFWKECKGKKR